MQATNCESCVNYVYDEDYECYTCLVNGTNYACPYYRLDDEYGVVKHQM